MAVAREQGAKGWELRASISQSRIWQQQGRRTEAKDLLASIIEYFPPDLNVPDLNEARALLGN